MESKNKQNSEIHKKVSQINYITLGDNEVSKFSTEDFDSLPKGMYPITIENGQRKLDLLKNKFLEKSPNIAPATLAILQKTIKNNIVNMRLGGVDKQSLEKITKESKELYDQIEVFNNKRKLKSKENRSYTHEKYIQKKQNDLESGKTAKKKAQKAEQKTGLKLDEQKYLESNYNLGINKDIDKLVSKFELLDSLNWSDGQKVVSKIVELLPWLNKKLQLSDLPELEKSQYESKLKLISENLEIKRRNLLVKSLTDLKIEKINVLANLTTLERLRYNAACDSLAGIARNFSLKISNTELKSQLQEIKDSFYALKIPKN